MKRRIVKESALHDVLASEFTKAIKSGLRSKERFAVALSGGRTPTGFYKKLTSDKYRDLVDWERVDFFFGDERDVSPMSERSNFRLANELLFKPLNIGQSQIFRWQTEIIEVAEVAAIYEQTLRRYFRSGNGDIPAFDLIILGLGDDGHTASLFPYSDAVKEKKRLAVSNHVERFDSYRLTLTLPVLNNAARVIFAVIGEEKASALRSVLEGPKNCLKFPAQCVEPSNGTLLWLISDTAGGKLASKAAA